MISGWGGYNLLTPPGYAAVRERVALAWWRRRCGAVYSLARRACIPPPGCWNRWTPLCFWRPSSGPRWTSRRREVGIAWRPTGWNRYGPHNLRRPREKKLNYLRRPRQSHNVILLSVSYREKKPTAWRLWSRNKYFLTGA